MRQLITFPALPAAVRGVLCMLAVTFAAEARAATAEVTDLTSTFAHAGLDIDKLAIFEIAGIVIIRGETNDRSQAASIGELVTRHGYKRVANLVRVREWAAIDAAITNAAQRELATHRALDGTRLRIHAQNGVLVIAGTVRHELQKDTALAVARRIDGVRAIETDLVLVD